MQTYIHAPYHPHIYTHIHAHRRRPLQLPGRIFWREEAAESPLSGLAHTQGQRAPYICVQLGGQDLPRSASAGSIPVSCKVDVCCTVYSVRRTVPILPYFDTHIWY